MSHDPSRPSSESPPLPSNGTEVAYRISTDEILDPGQLSYGEEVRGRQLAVRNGTITDAALIEWFLEERGARPTTRDNYLTQLRRLQCFMVHVMKAIDPRSPDRDRPLSNVRALQREDWRRLTDYLSTPPYGHAPDSARAAMKMDRDAKAIAENKTKKAIDWNQLDEQPVLGLAPVWAEKEGWRPFKGALKSSSMEAALTVIKNFYAWMADVEAIRKNPFSSIRTQRVKIGETAEARDLHHLKVKHWEYVLRAIRAMPAESSFEVRERARANWVFTLLVETGLRASEIANARSSMIRPSTEDSSWNLEVTRKGGVAAKAPLSETVMTAWAHYRVICGLKGGEPNTKVGELPLVSKVRGCPGMNEPLSRQSVWSIITGVCEQAAVIAHTEGDTHSEALLKACSPHWLRHTFGTWLVDEGTDLRSVRGLMEHKSLATTSIYVRTDGKEQRQGLNKMTSGLPRLNLLDEFSSDPLAR